VTGGLRGVGELSLLSARAALDQRVGGGRGAWMVAGRRTYLDLLLPRVLSGPESRFPYHFAELTARGDWTLAPGHRIEVSTLLEQDRLAGDIPDVSQGNRARWGNAMAQAAVTTQVGVLEARHAVGVSRFRGQLTLAPVDSALEASYGDVPERPVRAGVTHLALRGSWAPIDSGARRPAWDAGYALERQAADYLGEVRAVYLGEASARDTSAGRAALTQLAVWGARRFAPVDGLVLEAGMRVEAGGAVRGGGRVRPGAAPHRTLRAG
jgi:hypothetical protein